MRSVRVPPKSLTVRESGVIRRVAAPLLLLVGCAVAPTFGSNEMPEIRDLRFADTALLVRPRGALSVKALIDDTSFVLAPGARLRLTVTTSRGDEESLSLGPANCPSRPVVGISFRCLEFGISMLSGHKVSDIDGAVRAWGGRISVVGASGELAVVVALRRDNLLARIREIDSWPGVNYTFADQVTSGGSLAPVHSQLHAVIAINLGLVRMGDGLLQGVAGDTVLVSYLQPSGSVLSTSIVIAPEGPRP